MKKDKMSQPFPITSVCRDDVREALSDDSPEAKAFAESLEDYEMEWIARKMADAYCDCCFWIALRQMCRIVEEKREIDRR